MVIKIVVLNLGGGKISCEWSLAVRWIL